MRIRHAFELWVIHGHQWSCRSVHRLPRSPPTRDHSARALRALSSIRLCRVLFLNPAGGRPSSDSPVSLPSCKRDRISVAAPPPTPQIRSSFYSVVSPAGNTAPGNRSPLSSARSRMGKSRGLPEPQCHPFGLRFAGFLGGAKRLCAVVLRWLIDGQGRDNQKFGADVSGAETLGLPP